MWITIWFNVFFQILIFFRVGTIGPSLTTIQVQFNETLSGIDKVKREFLLGWIGGGFYLGMIIGSFLAMPIMKFIGRKLTLFLSGLVIFISTFGIFSPYYELLIFTRCLVGISVGIAATCGPLYCTENSPEKVRGIVGTTFVVGQLSGILLGFLCLVLPTWKYMFGMNFFTSLTLIISSFIMPESAFWRNPIRDINDINAFDDPESRKDDRGTMRKLFCDKNSLIRFLLGLTLIIAYQLSGVQAVVQYLPQVLEDAQISGVPLKIASIIVASWNFITCFVAIFLVDLTGRRNLIIYGQGVMFFCTLIMGFLFKFIPYPWCGYIYLVFVFIYLVGNNSGVNSLIFLLFTELFEDDLREFAQPLLTTILAIVQFLIGLFYLPLVVILTQPGIFWFSSFFNFLAWAIFVFLLPETKYTDRFEGYEENKEEFPIEEKGVIRKDIDLNDNLEIIETIEEQVEMKKEIPRDERFTSVNHYDDIKTIQTLDQFIVIRMHHLKGFEPELPNGYTLIAWIEIFNDENKSTLIDKMFCQMIEIDHELTWKLTLVKNTIFLEILLDHCVEKVKDPKPLQIDGVKWDIDQGKGRPDFEKFHEYFIKKSLLKLFKVTQTFLIYDSQYIIKSIEGNQTFKLPIGYNLCNYIEIQNMEKKILKKFIACKKDNLWRVDRLDIDIEFDDFLYKYYHFEYSLDFMRGVTEFYKGEGEMNFEEIFKS